MQVISFVNMKGGVGKTTLAVNVGYGLAALHKKNVLVVDGDPQFNATQYLVEDEAYLAHIDDDEKGTIYDIFNPWRPGPVKTTSGKAKSIDKRTIALDKCTIPIFNGGPGRGKLDLIPSTLRLSEIENFQRGTERRLQKYLKEKASHYDYVLIDCPPTITMFTQAAILASQKYIVPIKPDPLSVIGLPLLERWLLDFTDDNSIVIKSVGLVFTMVRGPTPARMKQVMNDLRTARKGQVFADHLSQTTYIAESVEAHQPIFSYNHSCKAARQMAAITNEFLKRT